jgi:hypothetical protein
MGILATVALVFACDWEAATAERSACFVAEPSGWREVAVGSQEHHAAMGSAYAEPYRGLWTSLEEAQAEAHDMCDAEDTTCALETEGLLWRAVIR